MTLPMMGIARSTHPTRYELAMTMERKRTMKEHITKLEPAFQSRLRMTVHRQKLTYRSYPAYWRQ